MGAGLWEAQVSRLFFSLLHFLGPSFGAFVFYRFAWELACGRHKFQGRNFFHCCIFGSPVSRRSCLTVLLGSWPGGGPSFKVGIFHCCIFWGPVSRFSFLTILLGSWPRGGPSFKVCFFYCCIFGGPVSRFSFLTALLGSWPGGWSSFKVCFFLLLHFWGSSFQVFIFDSFAWELAWGRPKFQGRNFFHCCIFGGPVSRFSFLTALLGSWPGGGPSFKVGFFSLLHFWWSSFQVFNFDSFTWELACGRPKFQGSDCFHCCIFGGPVSRFLFLTALLGSWPGGGPSFKVGIFSLSGWENFFWVENFFWAQVGPEKFLKSSSEELFWKNFYLNLNRKQYKSSSKKFLEELLRNFWGWTGGFFFGPDHPGGTFEELLGLNWWIFFGQITLVIFE